MPKNNTHAFRLSMNGAAALFAGEVRPLILAVGMRY